MATLCGHQDPLMISNPKSPSACTIIFLKTTPVHYNKDPFPAFPKAKSPPCDSRLTAWITTDSFIAAVGVRRLNIFLTVVFTRHDTVTPPHYTSHFCTARTGHSDQDQETQMKGKEEMMALFFLSLLLPALVGIGRSIEWAVHAW